MEWCHSSAATEINRLGNWHRVRWARKKQRVRRSCGVLTGGEGTQRWPEFDAAGNKVEQIEETAAGDNIGMAGGALFVRLLAAAALCRSRRGRAATSRRMRRLSLELYRRRRWRTAAGM
jgi:hypothetical protein